MYKRQKEAHKHGPENTFIYFVNTHRRRFFIHTIFQSYVFFDKFPALGPHYFTIRHHCDQTATFRRTKNVQDTRHRGRGQRLPAQIFPSLAEACRWLIINLKAIRHDDPAMNKKNIFSLARKKNIYYIYTIHYFYKPTLFIAWGSINIRTKWYYTSLLPYLSHISFWHLCLNSTPKKIKFTSNHFTSSHLSC